MILLFQRLRPRPTKNLTHRRAKNNKTNNNNVRRRLLKSQHLLLSPVPTVPLPLLSAVVRNTFPPVRSTIHRSNRRQITLTSPRKILSPASSPPLTLLAAPPRNPMPNQFLVLQADYPKTNHRRGLIGEK